MKEILINDLINNMSKYRLLFCPQLDYFIKVNNNENIEDVAKRIIREDKEKTVIFLLDKCRKYINCFVFNEEDNDIVTYKNKKEFKEDDSAIDNLNEFVTNILDEYNPIFVGIIQETKNNKYKSLKIIQDSTDEEFLNALLLKDIKCRHCHKLMNKENGLICETGDGYSEQDWYVTFKNGHSMNLWDYIDMNINPSEMSRYKAIKVLDYELKDR